MVRARVAALRDSGQELAVTWLKRIFEAQSIYFYKLFGVTMLIVGFGLLMVLSSSSIDSLRANNDAFSVFGHQFVFAIGGLAALLLASMMPPAFYFRFGIGLFGFGLVAQIMIQVTNLGVSVNGNKAWLNIAGFRFQPSEFIKLGLILAIARLMTLREENLHDERVFSRPVFLIGAGAVLAILWGSDMGTALIVAAIVIAMVLFSGAPISHFKWPMLLTAAGILFLVFSGSSRLGRILAWSASPTDDMANSYAWQSVHGVWAVAAGGIQGVGLGASKMKWSWIPEVENDFIFAVICEELGMIGAITLLAMFVYLAIQLYRIYTRSQDGFARYLIIGVMSWLLIQATVNIAVVLQMLPVFGVPLPLISAGGSSLVAGMGAIGIVLSLERENTMALGARPTKRSQQRKSATASNVTRLQPRTRR